MRLGVTLVIAALCASGTAVAKDVGKDAAKKDKVICKRDRDFETGSHRPAPRTCMKESEWKELAENTERQLRVMDERAGVVEDPNK